MIVFAWETEASSALKNPTAHSVRRSPRDCGLGDGNHYDGYLNTGLTHAEKADLVEYLKSL